METDTFMGHQIGYWIELEKRAQQLNVVDLLEELTLAYGKIGFYERRIEQMAARLDKNRD